MGTPAREVRCAGCQILLAQRDETGVTIRRNDFEAHYGGHGLVSILCYRPRCRRLNVLRIATSPTPEGDAA